MTEKFNLLIGLSTYRYLSTIAARIITESLASIVFAAVSTQEQSLAGNQAGRATIWPLPLPLRRVCDKLTTSHLEVEPCVYHGFPFFLPLHVDVVSAFPRSAVGSGRQAGSTLHRSAVFWTKMMRDSGRPCWRTQPTEGPLFLASTRHRHTGQAWEQSRILRGNLHCDGIPPQPDALPSRPASLAVGSAPCGCFRSPPGR